MWSIAQAKAHLSEVLRQARSGQPQMIGKQDSCVVISGDLYRAKIVEAEHDGQWLIDHAAGLSGDIALPPRGEDRADIALAD